MAVALLLRPASAQIEFSAAPAEFKVRPEGRLPRQNPVWDAASQTVSLAGARNEHVPFQLVVSLPPPAGRNAPPEGGFSIEITDLVSGSGRIARQNIQLYLEHVVLCYGKSSPVGDTGFWPDPLVPLVEPFSMAAPFRRAVRHRAIWVDIWVPGDVPAGSYTGTIQLKQRGQLLSQARLQLRVWDYTLPRERHLITYMGLSPRRLAEFHGVEPGSLQARELLKRYYAFLCQNRMEPWFNHLLQPRIRVTGDEVHLEWDEQACDLYLNQWKGRRVVLEAVPGELRWEAGEDPFSERVSRRVRAYVSQVAQYFREHGWLDHLVFNSPIDEPSSAEDYEATRRWATLVHEAAPGVPFLATESPVPDDPKWGPLTGYVNHFAVHGNALNRMDVREAIRQEQEKGGEVTWYISCDQPYPQPNYFIDGPAMDPVMVPWITWRHRLDGILYWALDFWGQTADPWLDPVTYLSGFFCSGGGVLNGEGSLLYPGNRVRRHTGQPDVDGPVASLRFFLLREGIEDYERLWLLRSLGEGEFADRVVSDLVVDISAFSRNVEALHQARERIAHRIAGLGQGASGKRD